MLGWARLFFLELVSRPQRDEKRLLRLLHERDMACARRLTPLSVRAATLGEPPPKKKNQKKKSLQGSFPCHQTCTSSGSRTGRTPAIILARKKKKKPNAGRLPLLSFVYCQAFLIAEFIGALRHKNLKSQTAPTGSLQCATAAIPGQGERTEWETCGRGQEKNKNIKHTNMNLPHGSFVVVQTAARLVTPARMFSRIGYF